MSFAAATYPRVRNSGSSVNLPLGRTIVFGTNLTLVDNGGGQATVTADSQATAPGGSSGQLQYNSSSAFAGAAFSAVATSGALLTLTAGANTDVPLTLVGNSTSQSGKLLRCLRSAGGAERFFVDPTGYIMVDDGFGGAVIKDSSGNQLFRAIRSTAWTDSAATSFFQIGTGSGRASIGPSLTRLAIDSVCTQFFRDFGSDGRLPLTGATIVEVLSNNTASNLLALRGKASQTGELLQLWGQSDTPTDRQQGTITTAWATATDASRKARVIHSVYDTAAREGFRIEADGSNPMIGFLGATASARTSVTGSRGGNAALAALLTELATKGLITDGTSV